METTVNAPAFVEIHVPPSQRWRVRAARVLQLLGWAGLGGLVLLLSAAVIAERAWLAERALIADASRAKLAINNRWLPAEGAPIPPAVVTAKLPSSDDLPLLISRIERAALAAGLPWNAAEYRLLPASETQAASLEVRCSFKAPYPRLRAMVADVLASVPVATFRELSFSRPTADLPEVEAKMAIEVYLADSPAQAGRKQAP